MREGGRSFPDASCALGFPVAERQGYFSQSNTDMRFTKMHGAGNDYVYVNAWEETLPADLPVFARVVSHRHTGVGSDGLIVIGPSDVADARMRIWNADGSESGMCGNGLRCVAKYLYDRGIAHRDRLTIETGRGVLTATLDITGGVVRSVRTSLGVPILRGRDIPTTLPGEPPLNVPLDVPPHRFVVTCVSMGNPHCVTFADSLHCFDVAAIGPEIESHPAFPERTNVGFARVVSREEIELRVWERGSGETQACGSGACAAVVAAVLTERTSRRVRCRLPGGELTVEWTESGEVHLSGPAVETFRGELSEFATGPAFQE